MKKRIVSLLTAVCMTLSVMFVPGIDWLGDVRASAYTINNNYCVPATVWAEKKISTYNSKLQYESNHYISQGDVCYISEVYTNGYVKVRYPTSSGNRWAYAKKSDFPVVGKKTNLGSDFKALIINTKCWKPIMQDDKANVVLTTEKATNYDATLWHFLWDSSTRSYHIYSYKNGNVMKVYYGKDEDWTNIDTRATNTGEPNTKWYIVQTDDGSYRLQSMCTSRVMELEGGNTADNTNVHTHMSNNTDAQKFSIYKLDASRDKLNYTISAAKTKVEIKTKVNVTVGGIIPYVYNYKFHILDPKGKETTVDNKCNPVYSFSGSATGKYVIWAEILSPLYTQKGSKTSKCVTINVTCTHKYGAWTTTKAATCSAKGSKTRTCSVCGHKETAEIAAAGHKYGAWTTTKAATCTTDGTQTRTCSVCKKTETKAIAKTGHTAVVDKAVAATCTTEGKTEGSHCSKCGAVIKAQTSVPATGHSYGSWQTTTEATCTKDGTQTRTCTRSGCTSKETRSIAALGHSYTSKVVAPTDTEQGYTLYTCTRSGCTYSYKDNYTSVSGIDLSSCTLTLSSGSYTYDGTAKTPSVTVKYGSTTLTKDKDYTVSYSNNTNAGTAYVTVSAKSGGKCKSGTSQKKSYTISAKSLSDASVTLGTTSYTYDGKDKKPAVTVKDGSAVLKSGTDYTVAYSNCKNIGTAKVTITGKGKYTGTKTVSYQIIPAIVSGMSVTKYTTTAVSLKWSKVSGATGYYVYKYNSKTKKWERKNSVTTNSATVKGLTGGTTYKFAVRAYTEVGDDVYTSSSYPQLSASTMPVAVKFKLTAGKRSATIKWTKQSSAAGYMIYYKTSKNGNWKRLKTVNKNTSTYTKKGLTSKKTYYFTVKAYRVVDGKTYNGKYTSKSIKVK